MSDRLFSSYKARYGEPFHEDSAICQARRKYKLWHAFSIDPDRDRSLTDEEKAACAALQQTGRFAEEEEDLRREEWEDA